MSFSEAGLKAAGEEAVAHLRDMVRFDTTNPPGQELALVRYLADLLTAEGVEVEVLVPYMQTGGTDARFLHGPDTTVYGFVPMRYEAGMDFFELCHGHDERVSVANVHFAVEVLFDVTCMIGMKCEAPV